jgi:hypothetical protein
MGLQPEGDRSRRRTVRTLETHDQEAKEVAEREVARETLEREEAERRAREAEEAAAAAAIPAAAEAPLGGYAGWACEYAAETGQEDSECGGGGCSGDNACAAISAGGWECAIDGTLVALGVGLAAPSAGASVAVSAAASAALGLATDVACEYSPVHNIELRGCRARQTAFMC